MECSLRGTEKICNYSYYLDEGLNNKIANLWFLLPLLWRLQHLKEMRYKLLTELLVLHGTRSC
jgi:hypothetical protein